MSSEPLTEAELEEALNGAAARTCPECARVFPTVQAMRGHLASHRRQAPPAGKGSTTPPPKPDPPAPSLAELFDAAGKATVHKAVKNAKTVGNLVSFGAPHLGLAIAGSDPAAQTAEWRLKNPGAIYVKSRAELAGELILEIRDPVVARQVLRILAAFNSLFEVEKAGELAASLGVATLVDVRVIPPDFTVRMGPVELPVAEATIGDVVAEWGRRGLYEQQGPGAPPPADGEHPPWPPEPEVIQGGVEST